MFFAEKSENPRKIPVGLSVSSRRPPLAVVDNSACPDAVPGSDPDKDPALFVSGFQDAKRSIFMLIPFGMYIYIILQRERVTKKS